MSEGKGITCYGCMSNLKTISDLRNQLAASDSNMMAEEIVDLHKTIKELKQQHADLNEHTKMIEKSNLDLVLEKSEMEKQLAEANQEIELLKADAQGKRRELDEKDNEIVRLKDRIRDTEGLNDSEDFSIGYLNNVTAANPKRTFLMIQGISL